MKPLKSIAGYNLLAILVYSCILRLVDPTNEGPRVYGAMTLIVIHFMICIGIAASYATQRKKDYARAWLLSSVLALLVGFSACYGNAVT